MLMEKRMYIALIFVAAFLCSYAQQSDKSTYLAHIRQADSLYMAGDPAGASRAFEAAFYQTEHIQPYHYTMQLALRLKPETTGWLSTGYSNA